MSVEDSIFKYGSINLDQDKVDLDQQATPSAVGRSEEDDSCFGSICNQIGDLFNATSFPAGYVETPLLTSREISCIKDAPVEESEVLILKKELGKVQNVNQLLNSRNSSLRRQCENAREELKAHHQFFDFIQTYYPAAIDTYKARPATKK